ncbi:hypothetical protein [Desulfonema magnum]|uniref:Uncharacterized protein n=1 Tax=Desulfonema magnum TaxID=45655 RepID=A0A975BVL3_9BACT|nr:hypothetical protein [Desulfonema magnum]QTA92453.1 Uncharacterized protein dnm_085330 [Desulfonema magnum]
MSNNDYQKEQLETLVEVSRHLETISLSEKQQLKAMTADYLSFRKDVESFQSEYFGEICTQKCYESKLSACCSREGIITFFADVVINVLLSEKQEIEALMTVLQKPNNGSKCVYLGQNGCMWHLKPIVCEMFLCDQAQKTVFGEKPGTETIWEELKQRKKQYTWPDRIVLFDTLEHYFLNAGYSSPLMYMHNSPGLLRVKKLAQIK